MLKSTFGASMSLKVAVVGLGQIGMGYDYESSDSVLTHCAAFSRHPGFDLVAGVDSSVEARKRFEKKFKKPAYASSEELFSSILPDAVSIAVPSELHLREAQLALAYPLRGILCEKPIAANLDEAAQLKKLSESFTGKFLVNYIRRFDPAVREFKQKMDSGELGTVYKGALWYSKGLLNNGSHFINLLQFLFGACTESKVLNKGRVFGGSDPEPDVLLRFGEVAVYMLAGKEECFSCGSLELYGTKGTLLYPLGDHPTRLRKAVPDPMFPKYKVLEDGGDLINPEVKSCMLPVVEAFYASMVNDTDPVSNIDTALDTMKLVEEIIVLSKQ
jgi:predicted dehydrogenase